MPPSHRRIAMTSAHDDRAVGAADGRDLGGAPAIVADARDDLLALKAGAGFACVRLDGDMRAGSVSGDGFYSEDTRHLSELQLTIGGAAPVVLSSTLESAHHAVVHGTTLALRDGPDLLVPQGALSVRRTLLVADRLYHRVTMRSFASGPIETAVELSLGADFADVFAVRGLEEEPTGRVLPPRRDGPRIRFSYRAADGERRETAVELDPPPEELTLEGGRAQATWRVALSPGEESSLEVAVEALHRRRRRRSRPLEQVAVELDEEHQAWVSRCTRIRSDDEPFDRVVACSVRDLGALMMPLDGDALPAAGIPWYVAAFGRDSLLTACEALMVNPQVARGTLLALARLQATEDDPWREAEPGKIPHELRAGELARTGRVPHSPYFGTADATPLFLMLAGHFYRWTADLETMTRLRPAFDAALHWIDEWGDRDGDGFVEYERRSPEGLVNHGWKDSADSVVHADGSLAEGPIALVEVQGYVYEAKLRIAEVYDALGEREHAERLRTQAAALRAAFNDAFWDAEEGFLVLALDGGKAQVRSVASNAAHCLYCGIVDDEKAPQIAERLMAPDMFCGWGIRTLSSDSVAYNPMSYHNGSVWPHDNAIAAAGLKRYGFDEAAARIADGLFDMAAGARDHRLPELFCGFDRSESSSIVPYPVACVPQAWAAAAPLLLVQSLLGITAHAPENGLTVSRPRLPERLGSLDVAGIRVGDAHASVSFTRTGPEGTAFALRAVEGDLQVTMTA
jgi:glycogen debranching enzyme